MVFQQPPQQPIQGMYQNPYRQTSQIPVGGTIAFGNTQQNRQQNQQQNPPQNTPYNTMHFFGIKTPKSGWESFANFSGSPLSPQSSLLYQPVIQSNKQASAQNTSAQTMQPNGQLEQGWQPEQLNIQSPMQVQQAAQFQQVVQPQQVAQPQQLAQSQLIQPIPQAITQQVLPTMPLVEEPNIPIPGEGKYGRPVWTGTKAHLDLVTKSQNLLPVYPRALLTTTQPQLMQPVPQTAAQQTFIQQPGQPGAQQQFAQPSAPQATMNQIQQPGQPVQFVQPTSAGQPGQIGQPFSQQAIPQTVQYPASQQKDISTDLSDGQPERLSERSSKKKNSLMDSDSNDHKTLGNSLGNPLSLGLGVAAIICGAVAFILSLIPTLSLAALVFGVVGVLAGIAAVVIAFVMKSAFKGLAIAGLVISVIACVVVFVLQPYYSNAIAEITNNATANNSDQTSSVLPGGTTDTQNTNNSSPAAPSVTPTPSGNVSNTTDLTIGESASLNNGLVVTVNSVQTGLTNYDGASLIGVNVIYRNDSTNTMSYNVYSWKGEDTNGAQRDRVYYSEGSDDLTYGDIPPGGTASGNIYFENNVVKIIFDEDALSNVSSVSWLL